MDENNVYVVFFVEFELVGEGVVIVDDELSVFLI